MTRSTFRVLFYANGSKEKNGIVPIMGRGTINGMVAQFSCKRSIAKELWDAKGNRAKGKSLEARETNLALDNIKAQIIKHYQRISDREAFVTAEMVRNEYYAAAMAKYVLQRGIRGSEARHTTTAQYYRDLKRQAGELKANVQQLQAEQRQAERQLDECERKSSRRSWKPTTAPCKARLPPVTKASNCCNGRCSGSRRNTNGSLWNCKPSTAGNCRTRKRNTKRKCHS